MLEENAYLVRARSDSENSGNYTFGSIARSMAYTEERINEGIGEPTATLNASIPVENINHIDANESGDLIDYNETSLLSQFHEDALRQAGCGLPQLRVLLSTGLAVMSCTVELAAIPLVLPSAQLELCIQPHERNWLLWISLVGRAVGSGMWGWSRRRGEMSALLVLGLFSAVAAFMPTYGTAVMARFCSSIGSGGIIPLSFSYLSEITPRPQRGAALSALLAFAGAAVLYADVVSNAVVPAVNQQMVDDTNEHFSGWHRYLLLCTIPVLAALATLLWADESPRYLLETGREVDAMMLYQSIHKTNQSKFCGLPCSLGQHGDSGSEYRLSELQLPGKRPASNLQLTHSVKMIYRTIFQIFSHKHRLSTFLLTCLTVTSLSMQFYISTYVPTTIQYMRDTEFEANKRVIVNESHVNVYYNGTIENVEYDTSNFTNCTFRDMTLSHVTFLNCTFVNVTFSNVRTSYTYFKGAFIVNSSIIDSDVSPGVELDAMSVVVGGVVRGVRGGCVRGGARAVAGGGRGGLGVVAGLGGGGVLAAVHGHTHPVIISALCLLLSPSIYFASSETALYIIEGIYTLLLTLIIFGTSVKIVETYPAGLRCTAHGIAMSFAWLGALIFGGIGASGGALTAVICVAILSGASIVVSSALRPTDNHVL